LNAQLRAVSKRIHEPLVTHPDAVIFLGFPGMGYANAVASLSTVPSTARGWP